MVGTGKESMLSKRFLTVGSGVFLVFAAGAVFAGIVRDFAEESDGIRSNALTLESLWLTQYQKSLDAAVASGAVRDVRIELSQAVFEKPLHLSVVNHAGRWILEWAWTPGWSSLQHDITRNGLVITDDPKLGTTVRGQVDLTLNSDDPLEAKAEVPCAFSIQVAVSGGKSGGTYQAIAVTNPPPIPMSRGVARCRIGPAVTFARPAEMPATDFGKFSVYRQSRMALGWEARAEGFYQRIRANEISRLFHVPLAEAAGDCVAYVPVRPAFETPAVKQKKRAAAGPSLDMIDLEGEAGADLGLSAETVVNPSDNDPAARAALSSLKAARAHTDAIVDTVRAHLAKNLQEASRAWTLGSMPPDDSWFGPWYGDADLVYDARSRVHRLPAWCEGRLQKWASVGTWRLIGPFRIPKQAWTISSLPEMVLDPESKYTANLHLLKDADTYTGPNPLERVAVSRVGYFGDIQPPRWRSGNLVYQGAPPVFGGGGVWAGFWYACVYADATVESETEQSVWAVMGVQQEGQLWLNGELVWRFPEKVDAGNAVNIAMKKLNFRKGSNTFRFRLESAYGSSWFWMRLCTQGAPLEGAALKAREDSIAAKRREIKPLSMHGFRNDLSSRFRGAKPPVAWDYKTGQNVKWHTPLPYWGNANPILVGDRVLVTMEPHWLLCLNRDDGRILWQKAVTMLDCLEDASLRKEGWRLFDEWWAARQARDAVPNHVPTGGKYNATDKWLSYSHFWPTHMYAPHLRGIWAPMPDGIKAALEAKPEKKESAQLVALRKKAEELEQSPDPQSVQDELTRVLKQIEELAAKEGAGQGVPELVAGKAALSRCHAANRAFMDFVGKHGKIGGLEGYWFDYDGFAFSTPVTDGKRIWWKNGMGALACLDMDGNVLWRKRITGGGGSGSIPSLVMKDDSLIVKTYNPTGRRDGSILTAFRASTGEVLWESEAFARSDWGANTPVVVTLANDRETMDVVITDWGTTIRLEDGKTLIRNMGSSSGEGSTFPMGDIIVMPRPRMAAYRLIMIDRDTVGSQLLWTRRNSGGDSYGGALDPDEGLFYFDRGAPSQPYTGDRKTSPYYVPWPCEVPNRHGDARKACIVRDARTGRELAAVPMQRKAGNYWSIGCAVPDSGVFMIGGDRIFQGGARPPFHITVIDRGRDPVVLARNFMDRCYGGPAFDAERMYLRQYLGVTCVGYTGEEGRRFEARRVADTVMEPLQARPPADVPAVRNVSCGRGGGGRDEGASVLEPNLAPSLWFYAGAFPVSNADAVSSVLANAARLGDGRAVSAGGAEVKIVALTPEKVPVVGRCTDAIDPENYTLVWRQRLLVPLHAILNGKTPCVAYFIAKLENYRQEQTLRYEQPLPGTRTWMGGVEIRDGDRVHVERGVCNLLVEVKVDADVPERPGLFLEARFWDSSDPAAELAQWKKGVKRIQPHLDRVVELAPDSVEAARAKVLLGGL